MEMNFINEIFFEEGILPANIFREGLKKDRRLSLTIEFSGARYFVYVPELFKILMAKEIPLHDGRFIDGTIYINDYVNGYNKGIEYFKGEFPENHLLLNSDQYFSSLHYCLYHEAPNFSNECGWIYWINNSYPISLNPTQIEQYGFCAGIKFCLNHLKRKYPTLFKKIEKCEHDLPNQITETKKNKLKVNQIALIHVYEGIQITRENAGEIAAKHGFTAKNSGEGLFQDYTTYSSKANRKGKPTPCTPKRLKNKIELFESVVNYLSNNNKQRAIDEINILKTIFENEYQ